MRREDEAQHQAQLDQDGDVVATAHSRGHPPQEWRHRLKITQSKYLPAAKRQRSFENVSEACPNGGSTTELWRGVKRFGPRPKLVVLRLVPARAASAPLDPCEVLRVARGSRYGPQKPLTFELMTDTEKSVFN